MTLLKVKQADSYHSAGTWRVINDTMMEVTWSNGVEGIRVRLQRGVDDIWRGWTEPYSDGGTAVPGARVSVKRVNDGVCRFSSP